MRVEVIARLLSSVQWKSLLDSGTAQHRTGMRGEGGSNLDAASSMVEKKKVFVEGKNVGAPSEEVTMG